MNLVLALGYRENMASNSLVSGIFRGIAQLLEIQGDNPFRIRAYLRAAESLDNLKDGVEDYVVADKLGEIPGVGPDLAEKIREIVRTGKCHRYEELKGHIPGGVVEMMQVPGLGPKTVKLFFERLKIDSLEKLKKAALGGRLTGLSGVREKTVENILKGLELVEKGKERIDLLTATRLAEEIVAGLQGSGVAKVSVAGSLRRMKETVRDIDILAVSGSPAEAIGVFVSLPCVARVLSSGATKSAILTKDDIQVDLRVLADDSYGAALLYFTGSKSHNIKLRQIALRQKLKINEYGLFDGRGRRLASKTEKDIYRRLGLDFIVPELREDKGEIEAARSHRLPRLVELADLKGDFHAHTRYSDGKNSVSEMAEAARRIGYEYICLTDHSVGLKVAGGLDAAQLKQKRREVDRVNAAAKGFRVLFCSEVEIDSDGNLDYDQRILSHFDVVVAAIHSGFKQSKNQLTKRLVRACRNKFVHIIAHPTGRLWPTRESYDLDFDEVFRAARETNTALEINAFPSRLDLSDALARKAKSSGVRLVISTDAHATDHLSYMKFGVGLARRAWLEKEDLLNSHGVVSLLKTIRKR